MLKAYRKIIEYLSSIWNLLRNDIPELNSRTISIEYNLQVVDCNIQNMEKRIEHIESLIFGKDTEIIIYNGKKYRIAELELSKSMDNGNKAILNLSCVETQE